MIRIFARLFNAKELTLAFYMYKVEHSAIGYSKTQFICITLCDNFVSLLCQDKFVTIWSPLSHRRVYQILVLCIRLKRSKSYQNSLLSHLCCATIFTIVQFTTKLFTRRACKLFSYIKKLYRFLLTKLNSFLWAHRLAMHSHSRHCPE